ncbi:MAG: nuclear transport factor 2 family protein [Rhodocyclaceae bacterium]|nr:nuclear transport factor 2 family protein [Rhodocyclaceae bacterium]
MPTQAEMKATMVKYVERVNAGDADGVVALYADGATIEDPVGSPPRADRAAITELYRNAVATNVRLKILAGPFGSFANAAAMAAEVRVDVPVGFPGEGPKRIPLVEVMTFDDDGKITSMRAYWGAEEMHPA